MPERLSCNAIVRPLFWMVLHSLDDDTPISRETHGPGICQYCGKRREVLKTEPRSQKSYCRKCAPGRETDEDWPNDPSSATRLDERPKLSDPAGRQPETTMNTTDSKQPEPSNEAEREAGFAEAHGSAFEMVDATDDEQYFPLGVWLTLESAIAALDECKDPDDLGSDGCHDDYAKVEIRQRAIGCYGYGKKVYQREWSQKYDEAKDEYEWHVMPNLQA